MSTVKNPTFTFDLTQIQVVSFQCNQFVIENNKDIKYGLKIIILYNLISTAVNGDIFIKNLQGVSLHLNTYTCKYQTATYLIRFSWIDIA
jgi:hypothetical protein